MELLRKVPGVHSVEPRKEGLILSVEKGPRTIPLIFDAVRSEGLTVESVMLKVPTLEDVFIKNTGRSLRDERVEGIDQLRSRGRQRMGRRRGH
jgi:ABC-2 type transport system ATP-binding protein